MKTRASTLVVLSLWGIGNSFAGSGADALLKSVAVPSTASSASVSATKVSSDVPEEVHLSDPFLIQFYTGFMQQNASLPLEVKDWVRKVARGDFESAAHLWTVMQGKIPAPLLNHAHAAQAYLLFKLDLPQSFVQFWIEQIRNPEFLNSSIAAVVEQTISGQGFATWFYGANVQLDATETLVIQALDPNRSPMTMAMIAHAWSRKGEAANTILDQLPKFHPYRSQLARTVAFSYAKKGDLANAARILKRDVEPELEAKKDPKLLAPYYLQIARFLYQAGALDGAAQYYQKIPNGLPEYLTAQEELTWVWLREGKIDRLRGSLVTLSSEIFADRFFPEVELVKAISNLKLCYYSDVEKDFNQFMIRNKKFAKEIDSALSAVEPPAFWKLDHYSIWARAAFDARATELAKLKTLSERSMSAALPAVGVQSHWMNYENRLVKSSEEAKKALHSEYRRQWRIQRNALQEGIRKMQFVKVELLSQLALAQNAPATDQVSVVQSSRSTEPVKFNTESNQQTYRFDGVVWSDELFKLRSVVRGKCMGQ